MLGKAADHEIIGVPDQDWGVFPHVVAVTGILAVADSGGFLKAVQRDIQQQGADDPAFSQAAIMSLAGNDPSWARRKECEILSKAAARSASRIHTLLALPFST